MTKKNILAIIGSASKESSNLKLVRQVANLMQQHFVVTIFDALSDLPHFDPQYTDEDTPQPVADFRQSVAMADGILICTPEYIFSIPSRLKNAIEWCVSTTVFSKKPIGLITASAGGAKAHEELKLIMKTVETVFTDETTLLVSGIKGKINREGAITDQALTKDLSLFIDAYKNLVSNNTTGNDTVVES